MIKYIIYIRVSTQAQGVSHLGLDAQLRECKQYVSRRNGKILTIYEEIKSGSHTSNRPIVLEAIAHAKKDDAVLLVARLDRLGRSQAFLTSVRQSGIKIESVEHGAMSTMLFGIYAAISEHERELISSRTKAGLAQAKLNGVVLGRHTWGSAHIKPNDNRHKQADEHHKAALHIMLDARKEGESYKSIVAKLDRYNLRTQNGNQYTDVHLRKLMRKHLLKTVTIVADNNGESTCTNEDTAKHANKDQEC